MWQYWIPGLRCVFVVVFGVSAWSKLRRRSAWGEFVASTRVIGALSGRQAVPVAVAVVAGEISAVVLCAVPMTGLYGFGLSAVMLTGFGVAVARVIRRVRAAVRCQCFGPATVPLGPVHVVRNIALAGLAVTGLLAAPSAGAAPLGVALALCGGALVAAVAIRLDEIVGLFT